MRTSPLRSFGLKASLAVVSSGLFASSLQAAVTWKGTGGTGGDGTWGMANHWSPSGVPTASVDAIFSGTGGIIATPGSNFAVRDLKFESGAYTLTVNSGGGSSRTLSINTFSGADLSKTLITTANGASSITWTLAVTGSTSYTGATSNGTGTVNLVKSDTGFLDVSRASMAHNNTQITGGILRISGSASGVGVPPGGIGVGSSSSAGILEVDGNGNASTLSRTLGAGAGTLRLGSTADGNSASLGGFSAVNGSLTINLSSGATLSWTNGGYFRVLTLQLGSEGSTDRVIWANAINITGTDKTIRAGNGAAAIDGEMSGALAMNGGSDAILTKDGEGTMLLSGTSSAFAGRLHVTEGKLLVGGGLATATSNATYGIKVDSGAALGGGGAITLSNAAAKISVDGTLQAGEGDANKTLTLSSNLSMEANSILSFAIKGEDESDHIALAGGTSWTFQADQLVSIIDKGVSLDGGLYTLVTGLTGFGSYDFSNWQVTSNVPLAGNLFYQGTTLYYQVVPEPSLFALTGLGLGAGFVWMRRRKA